MKTYLQLYNLTLTIGWLSLFLYTFNNGLQLDNWALLLLNICQLAAILEIVHAYLGWVKSPWTTTILQVSSRIFALLLINILPNDAYISCCNISGVQLILVAWSVTEIVRYSFYFSQLSDLSTKILTYLRYSLFLALYPIGVMGETLIILSAMQIAQLPTAVLLGFVLIIYAYFFPKLYNYMRTQRRKKL